MKYKIILTVILSLGFILQLTAQERLITGKVTDVKGNPLGGVTITAKDYPSLNTISGVDGEFRIEVFDFTQILSFAFAGMKTKEVALGDLDRLLVVMEFLPYKNPDPWSLMLNIFVGQTHVYNNVVDSHPDWEYSGDPGFKSSFEIEYFVTQNFGIGTGVAYHSYNSSTSVNYFSNTGDNTISRIDQDGDQYYLYNTVNHLTEKWRIRTLNFPINLKVRLQPGRKWSYQANVGINIINVFSAKVKATGQSEWQAYYPAYHVVIYDVPPYGYSDYDINEEFKVPSYKKMTSSFFTSIGVSRRIKKEINLDLNFYYERGLSDLAFTEPIHPADFLNTVGTVGKTTLKSWGLMLGFRYHLRKKR